MNEEITPEPSPSPKKPDTIDWILMAIGCAAAIALAIISGLGLQKPPTNKPPIIPLVTVRPTGPTGPTIALIHTPPIKTSTHPLPTAPTVPPEQSNYILPFSNTRAVVTADLTSLSPWDLKVARNEIYARHGRPFVHQDLSCYFSKQSWYQVDPKYTDESLSKLEVQNALAILEYETSINSPLIATDSGCK